MRKYPLRCAPLFLRDARARRKLDSEGALSKLGRYRTPLNLNSNWILRRPLAVTPAVIDFLLILWCP